MFERIYHTYKQLFFNYLLKMTNDYHISEDLLQESFLKIADKLDTLQDPAKIKSWGFRIVINTCRDWYRQNKKNKVIFTDDIDYFLDKNTIYDDVFHKDLQEIIKNILNSLHFEEKEVFILKHYENKTYSEIARELNLSSRTVKRKMKSALIKIIDKLEGMEIVNRKNINLRMKI